MKALSKINHRITPAVNQKIAKINFLSLGEGRYKDLGRFPYKSAHIKGISKVCGITECSLSEFWDPDMTNLS